MQNVSSNPIIYQAKNIREAHVNGVVLMRSDKTPRSQWKIGKKSELIKNNDGRIRGVIVLKKTNGTEHLFERPTNRLYPVECDKKDYDAK